MIVPAIIPRSAEHLIDALGRIPFATEVQIDIVDGVFAAPSSWPYEPLGSVEDVRTALSPLSVEVDLMVSQPIEAAYLWHDAGATRFVFHLESVTDVREIAELKAERGCFIGACISNDTPLHVLEKHINAFDFVQVMGIKEIGSQGRGFDERALTRIAELRAAHPALPISVDGSVNEDTLPRLVAAGANRFAVGSAIMDAEDPQRAFEALAAIARP